MICARCGKETNFITWTILPFGTQPVPTCYDDRSCIEFKPKNQKQPRRDKVLSRVQEIARRFAI